MKKIQQQIIKLTHPGFTAEDVIAGLKKVPGYIFAYAYATTEAQGGEADAVVLLTAVTGEPRFHDNQRVAYVDDSVTKEITVVDGDGWVGLFIDGQIFRQDNDLQPKDWVSLLEKLGVTVKLVDADLEWLDSMGHYPDNLSDVKYNN